MRRILFAPVAAALLLLSNGCAKSPAGGPVIRAVNRLQANLSIAGTLNPEYYYGVAFDETGGGSGPAAVIGGTVIPNGIVGGRFRLLVLYHRSGFRIFYRSNPDEASTEREISGTNGLFVVTPRASQKGVNFTIDLDALLPDTGGYIFPHTTGTTPTLISNSFDINAVTSNVALILDNNFNIVKPVDALGPQQVATPVEVQIAATRTLPISDPVGDENFFDSTYNNFPFADIDITGLQIGITRSN